MSEEVHSNAKLVEDLFHQSLDLATSILAEVKFIGSKLDEYAPTITPWARNSYRDFKDHSIIDVEEDVLDLT